MVDFKLGDKVTVSDFMVRVQVNDSWKLTQLLESWEGMPEPVKVQAAKERPGGFRLWVPASIEAELGWVGNRMTKHHPSPHFNQFKLPESAIVTRKIKAQDGKIFHEEYGTEIDVLAYIDMYEATYHLHRVPLRVLPSMVTKIES